MSGDTVVRRDADRVLDLRLQAESAQRREEVLEYATMLRTATRMRPLGDRVDVFERAAGRERGRRRTRGQERRAAIRQPSERGDETEERDRGAQRLGRRFHPFATALVRSYGSSRFG